MVAGCSAGGILQLLELIEEHPVEAARDFREKFHIPIGEIGRTVTYGEAVLLASSLMRDPTSWLQASSAGWEHPTSWGAIILYDLFDLQLRSKLKNAADFHSYPRPWNTSRRRSNLNARQARAILKK